jgi:NAD+ synthase (glutamine-hydrolysing)
MNNIAIAQINPTVGDLKGNAQKIINYISEAKKINAQIVIFPEQCVTGYPAQDLLLHQDFVEETLTANEEIAKHTEKITAIVGSIERTTSTEGKPLTNVALIMQNGRIIARQAKTLLPTYDVFDERRYFSPAPNVEPIQINGIKYGIQICEDMWDETYERKITNELVKKGAEIIINISASPWAIEKLKTRHKIISKHVQQNKIPFIYVNIVGGQDELIFDGTSIAVHPNSTICQLPSFTEKLQLLDFNNKTINLSRWEEETFQGLTLGLTDYFHKNNLTRAILGISGGIDSAMTATIAANALGTTNVLGLWLPSEFNTTQSYEDAQTLSKNLGIKLEIVPIKPIYETTINVLKESFANKPFDVTEENIQARLRMMILMAYSNKHGYTLLNTSDKSETALGYCTLYGDMSGAISVISDLTKPEVYSVAKWYNSENGEIIPQRTLTKPPSPELKHEQVAPFDYEKLSPLLEALTNRTKIAELKQKYTTQEIHEAYKRWKANEFKRWQAPIALKCKQTSFGMGRLYPITNKYIPKELT